MNTLVSFYPKKIMESKTLTAAETKARILQVIEKNPFISLATFGTDGYPDVRMLVVAAKDDADSLWFATGTESNKIAQLRNNPKAAIYGYTVETETGCEYKEFRQFGSVELLNDSVSRRKVWQGDFIQHFPDGVDSPSMIVLHFKADRGMYDNYKESGKF
jgi:general stress protein 26